MFNLIFCDLKANYKWLSYQADRLLVLSWHGASRGRFQCTVIMSIWLNRPKIICKGRKGQIWLIGHVACTLDNDLYRQLKCRRCAPNVILTMPLFLHFQNVTKNIYFFNLIPWTGATLWEQDLRNFLPLTLDNDFYRQLRCHRCAFNLLF